MLKKKKTASEQRALEYLQNSSMNVLGFKRYQVSAACPKTRPIRMYGLGPALLRQMHPFLYYYC